jgi:hypothetical protein
MLLLGDSGAGKTYSITTLLKAGLEVFVLITEPNGIDSLIDAVEKQNLDINKLHWKILSPVAMDVKLLGEQAAKVNALTFEGISKLTSGVEKSRCTQYIDLIKTVAKFVDDRTGVDYGDITTWGPDRVFVLDSLTGLVTMAIQNTIGLRPTIQLQEYGIIQTMLENTITLFTNLKCFFVMTAHVDRLVDEVNGGMKIMAYSIGKKLSPVLPRFFSEVVYVYREGTSFWWSTATLNVSTKQRSLPISDKIPPSFEPIVSSYHNRLKLINSGKEAPTINAA